MWRREANSPGLGAQRRPQVTPAASGSLMEANAMHSIDAKARGSVPRLDAQQEAGLIVIERVDESVGSLADVADAQL